MELSEAMLVFVFVSSFLGGSMANQYDVGGSAGWSTNAKTWSLGRTFEVGDIFTFNYDRNIDSVFQVDEDEFRQCMAFRPLATYRTGQDNVTLHGPGRIYFISGNLQKCVAGEKLDIRVNDDSGSSGHRDPNKPYPYSPPGYPTQSSSTSRTTSECLKSTVLGLMLHVLMFLLVFWRV